MAAKKVETCSINSLPDEVLCHILTFLPTKLAASTLILSKRWRNLLPLVHNLDFDDSMFLYPDRTSATSNGTAGFLEFIDRTLSLLGDSPLNKVSLKWKYYMSYDWYIPLIRNVLQRGTLELHLSSPSDPNIDPEFFFSKTLVKLTLSHGSYTLVRYPSDGVLFPALKILSLVQVSCDGFAGSDLYECFLNCCPLLEEVNIFAGDPLDAACWRKHIWGSTLQRISVFYRCNDLECHSLVAFNTPNLVYLDYSSYVAQDYHFNMDSLVEARLDLILWKYNAYIGPVDYYYEYDSTKGDAWGDATELIAAIRNVVTLHLRSLSYRLTLSLSLFSSCPLNL